LRRALLAEKEQEPEQALVLAEVALILPHATNGARKKKRSSTAKLRLPAARCNKSPWPTSGRSLQRSLSAARSGEKLRQEGTTGTFRVLRGGSWVGDGHLRVEQAQLAELGQPFQLAEPFAGYFPSGRSNGS